MLPFLRGALPRCGLRSRYLQLHFSMRRPRQVAVRRQKRRGPGGGGVTRLIVPSPRTRRSDGARYSSHRYLFVEFFHRPTNYFVAHFRQLQLRQLLRRPLSQATPSLTPSLHSNVSSRSQNTGSEDLGSPSTPPQEKDGRRGLRSSVVGRPIVPSLPSLVESVAVRSIRRPDAGGARGVRVSSAGGAVSIEGTRGVERHQEDERRSRGVCHRRDAGAWSHHGHFVGGSEST